MDDAFTNLENGVYAALETYSNVHRGNGHNSMVSTYLYEKAREIVLEYLGLSKRRYVVIFCSPVRAAILMSLLEPDSYRMISTADIGLPIGVRALAVRRKALPKGIPFQTGGGTARLIAPGWVIWSSAPGRFEAGTPSIINVIALARALILIGKSGNEIFRAPVGEKLSTSEILDKDELSNYSGRELLDQLRQKHIGRNVWVPTMEGSQPFVNLDNAASTPTFIPVWKAVCQTWRQPEQLHQEVIESVRSICAGMLGAPLSDYEVIFTSNTTEAINLVTGFADRASDTDEEPVVINTLLEHSSNDLPWRKHREDSLIRLSIDKDGIIDLTGMESLLSAYNKENKFGKKRIALVAVSGASNVLGVFNDLEEISRIVHKYGARLLVDAAQLVAHRKVEMEKCGIDFLAFSAHKVYAPFGCGVLVAKKGLLAFRQNGLELIQSSGEENAAGIAALGKALVLLQRIGMDVIREYEDALTRQALLGLAQVPGLRMYGIKDPDSPGFAQKGGVIAFSLKGFISSRVASDLALRGGIGIRYGCHCAHLLVKHILNVGHGLERFQRVFLTLFPKMSLPGVARVSLGLENSEGDINALIRVLGRLALKNQSTKDRTSVNEFQEPLALKRGTVKKLMKEFVRNVGIKVYTGE